MLSFKDLTEKKSTKVKINPRLEDIKEGDKKKCSKCDGKGCEHCDDTGYHTESCGGSHGKKKKKPMSEAKKKDDTYLETDFKKRQANNEKARKDLMKGPQMKNPHFESTETQAYVSQEEVSEEGNQSVGEEETEILTFGQFQEVRNAYAVGMASAMKQTGDKPPLEKSTITKAHKIAKAIKKEEVELDEGVKGAIKGAVKGAAKGAALGALGAAGVTAAGLTGGAAIPAAAAAGAITHGAYNAAKGASQNDKLHKLRQADQKKRDAKLLASAKTKKEETEVMEFDDFIAEMRRGPAAPGKAEKGEKAKASLDAVKKRQDVLDKHEKKTGKKLDITKTPEHKAHKKDFPGSRQQKKVKGAKETALQTHNRRVSTYMDRLKKHGKTTKQKRDDEAMAKHTSRFD
jgi:hypothetical protein